MTFVGEVTWLGKIQTGQRQDGTVWARREFVVTELSERYPQSMVMTLNGDMAALPPVKEGMKVKCSYSCKAREYQGRWYNNIDCWRVEVIEPKQEE